MRFRTLLIGISIALIPLAAPPRGQATPPTEACRIETDGRAHGISADICAYVARRWLLLAQFPPKPGDIRFAQRSGHSGTGEPDRWSLQVPAPGVRRGSLEYRDRDGLLTYHAEGFVPHEAGHYMFMSHVGRVNRPPGTSNYGTPLPDWIDEAVAVWMESQQLRANRMRSVHRTKPSLSALVTMRHPGEESLQGNLPDGVRRPITRTVIPPCAKCVWLPDSLRSRYQITDFGLDRNGRADTVIWYADRDPAKNETVEERQFYPLAYSLLRFIRMRGGSHAIDELVSRYRADPLPRAQALVNLPGLPASIAALETAWREWLNNPPAEDK